MSERFSPAQRALQERFGTTALADRVSMITMHPMLTDPEKAFIGSRDLFFLSTVDADGQPTCSYKGGAAGFAKGGATIKLAEADGGTRMTYVVKADVGGKLAQLGGRLIEGTSKKLAGEFFDAFEKLVVAVPVESAVDATPEPAAAAPAAKQSSGGFMGGLWIPIAVAAFAAAAYWLSTQKLIG